MTSRHAREETQRRCGSEWWSTVAIVVVCVLGLGAACDESERSSGESTGETEASQESLEQDGESAGPEIVYPDAGTPEASTVVARAGELMVTFEQYRTFMHRSRLFAPEREGEVVEIPRRRKADPRIQTQSLRSVLEHHVLQRLADERNIEVEPSEIEEFIRDHDKLSRWAATLDADAGDTTALPADLEVSDLRAVARRRLLRRRLRDELVESPTDDQLWELYRNRNTRVRIAYVSLQNSPDGEAIDAFLERHSGGGSSRIREYYREHADEFRQPDLVDVAIVRPEESGGADRETLEKAADRLSQGAEPADVADALGFEAEAEVYLRRQENREAFGAEEGATGFQMQGPRGAYAWRVEGHREGGLPELDRALRREVASQILREEPVPAVERRADELLEAMRRSADRGEWPYEGEDLAPLRDILADAGSTVETTEPFAQNSQGRVPGLGLAEPVMERAFELTRESPVADEPVLTRSRLVAFMLIDREEADRETFRRERDTFRRTVLEKRREGAVRRAVDDWLSEHEPTWNLAPIQATYGRLKKE